MKSKKKVLGVYVGNFETYTRYSEVADKEKVLRATAFVNSLNRATWKTSLGNPGLEQKFVLYFSYYLNSRLSL